MFTMHVAMICDQLQSLEVKCRPKDHKDKYQQQKCHGYGKNVLIIIELGRRHRHMTQSKTPPLSRSLGHADGK